MSVVKEFKDFINRGNVVDLAVAVVLGTAFNAIVKAIVDGLFMAPLNSVLPQGGWQAWHVGPFQVGPVLAAALNFLIVAFAVFLVVNKVMKGFLLKKKEEAAAPAATPEDILLLREIRDQLKARP